MDEEDLADAEEAKQIQTTAAFAGLGSTRVTMPCAASGLLQGLFRPEGETMGVKLLKRMGWRRAEDRPKGPQESAPRDARRRRR